MSAPPSPRRDSWDVFVSYSRRDIAWVRAALAELQARHRSFMGGEELTLFFDEQAIEVGESWRDRLQQGLRGSHFMIAFLSGNYTESPNCTWEWDHFERHERRRGLYGEAIGPVFFVTAPDGAGRKSEEQKIRAWLDARRWRNDLKLVAGDEIIPLDPTGEEVLQLAQVRQRLEALDNAIIRKRELAATAGDSPSTIPSHNPNFCGRDEQLRLLRQELQARPAVVTCGLGGMGKTALAFEYAQVFAHAYPGGRFWVPCEGKSTLVEALVALGGSKLTPLGAFGLLWEPTATADEQLAALRQWLHQPVPRPGAKLLVLDNIDVDASGFLVPSHGQPNLLPNASRAGGQIVHLLATSRGEVRQAVRCPLDELATDDAVEVMRRHCAADGDEPGIAPKRALTKADLDVMREIAELLGGFTLAVEAVAVHLAEQPTVSLAGYRDLLQQRGVAQLDTTAAKDHVNLQLHREKLLTLTLSPTLQNLADDEQLALNYAAVLPPDCVPLEWIRAGVAKTYPTVAADPVAGAEDEHRWTQIWRRLAALRLLVPDFSGLRPDQTPHTARVHRLVGEIVKSHANFSDDTLAEIRQIALKLSDELHERFFEPQVAAWLPALRVVAALWQQVDPPETDSAVLSNILALVESSLGNLPRAKELLERAIAIEEQVDASDPPSLAASYSNLATVEYHLGNLPKAKELLERAIAVQEQAYDSDHPTLAISHSLMATVEHDLGNLPKAKELLERAIAIEEQFYPSNHPRLALRYSRLAMVERSFGNISKSRELLERAIAIGEDTYTGDHPTQASRYSNLALLEKDSGNFTRAKELLRQTIAMQENAYASDHPELANSYSILASVEQDLGNFPEAKELGKRAITIQEQFYPSDHPTLATSYSNMALIERALENLPRAKELLERAIAILERVYACNHPTLATVYSNLAVVEADLGNLPAAKKLWERVIATQEQAYDGNHPTLATSYTEMALIERALENLPRAKELLERAIAIEEQFNANNHNVLGIRYVGLARVERELGNLHRAKEILERAIVIYEKAYDSDALELANSYSFLADEEADLGNLPAVKKLWERVIAIQEQAYDGNHPTLATSYWNLALVEQKLDNLLRAKELLERAIAIEEQVNAKNHNVLGIRYVRLARVERDLGNRPRAQEILERAIVIYEKAYDSDALALANSYSFLADEEEALGNLPAAKDLLERAIAIEEKAYARDDPELVYNYFQLALVERALGNLPVAKELLERAIAIQEQVYDNNHPALATSYWNIGTLVEESDDRFAARGWIEKAYRIYSERQGENHPDTVAAAKWLRDHP